MPHNCAWLAHRSGGGGSPTQQCPRKASTKAHSSHMPPSFTLRLRPQDWQNKDEAGAEAGAPLQGRRRTTAGRCSANIEARSSLVQLEVRAGYG